MLGLCLEKKLMGWEVTASLVFSAKVMRSQDVLITRRFEAAATSCYTIRLPNWEAAKLNTNTTFTTLFGGRFEDGNLVRFRKSFSQSILQDTVRSLASLGIGSSQLYTLETSDYMPQVTLDWRSLFRLPAVENHNGIKRQISLGG